MINRFGQISHIVPVLSPVDKTTAAFNTALVDMKNAHRVTFIVHFGVITSASAAPTIILKASTVGTTVGATAIAFKYRVSAAVGTDTLGAITDATSAGVLTTTSDDGMIYLIDVDPGLVAALSSDARWVYLSVAGNANRSACVVGVCADIEPRYNATSPTSAS